MDIVVYLNFLYKQLLISQFYNIFLFSLNAKKLSWFYITKERINLYTKLFTYYNKKILYFKKKFKEFIFYFFLIKNLIIKYNETRIIINNEKQIVYYLQN